MVRHLTLLALTFLSISELVQAETMEHNGVNFFVYRLDPEKDRLHLFLQGKDKPTKMTELEKKLNAKGHRLRFAMNSGIFEGNFVPTGLHISQGKPLVPLNRKDYKKQYEGEWTPNFFLKENGVFFVRQDGSAAVMETEQYHASGEKPRLATQSGPLLVWNNTIHNALTPDGTSKRYRNGVGVTKNGQVILVCSHLNPKTGFSNLHNFATLFRDKLGCPNALYLDGDISYIFIKGVTPPLQDTNLFAGVLAITEEIKE